MIFTLIISGAGQRAIAEPTDEFTGTGYDEASLVSKVGDASNDCKDDQSIGLDGLSRSELQVAVYALDHRSE